MGVHYFYTWLTTRYPMIVQKHHYETMPIIDNFYLDLNGVFYLSSQDKEGVFREVFNLVSQEEIHTQVLDYINFLIKQIKPRKTIFLALDGVAPGAKMKDQRNRRYRVYKQKEEEKEFLQNHLKIPQEAFKKKDISLSPGQKFAGALHEKLEFFIKRKIKEDEAWSNLKVVFSGTNVPGEGEHKIMDFVREWQRSKDFDENETHCFYGNDSDLVMLALMTHLPFLCILREQNIPYKRKIISKSMNRLENFPKMELIFINILKEYLELEYRPCLGEDFDLEKLVNDFVFLTYFMGTDFVPQVFCMNTKLGNFDLFMKILGIFYRKKHMYLTKNQNLNLESFFHLIKYLKDFEKKLMEDTIKDFMQRLKELKKMPIYKTLILGEIFLQQESYLDDSVANFEKTFQTLDEFQHFLQQQHEKEEEEVSMIQIEEKEDLETNVPQSLPKAEKEKKYHQFEQNFIELFCKYQKTKKLLKKIFLAKDNQQNFEKIYYKHFFNMEECNYKICYEYLKGLNFIFQYYFIGCPSWDWIYPYEMPPLFSDLFSYLKNVMENGIQLSFQFSPSEPFFPYFQLLTILPKKSFHQLPQIIQQTLQDYPDFSDAYYPETYQIVPHDRQKEYTWHADLPEIDFQKIKNFEKKINWQKLNDNEKKINTRGKMLIYKKDFSKKEIIQSKVNGFEDDYGPIKIEEVDKKFQTCESIFEIDKTKISQKIFPSVKIFKDISLKKIKKKNREVIYFFINKKTMKKYWEKINQGFKQLKMIKNAFPFRIYSNPVFNRMFVSYQVDKIEKEQYETKIQPLIDQLEKKFEEMGILFEDINSYKEFKFMYLFHVEIPVFANVSFNMGDPKVHLKTIEDKKIKSLLFLDISLKPQYLSTMKFSQNIDINFKDKSICTNLFNGDLVYMKKLNWSENGEHDFDLLVSNTLTQNLNLQKSKEKLILLTPQILLKEFNLNLQEKNILFLILDNFTILTDQKISNVLLFGDGFEMGLQFIKVLNYPKEKWLTVNSLVRLYPHYAEGEDFMVTYDSFDEQKKKPLQYNLFFSYYGFTYTLEYFKENLNLIDYFKKNRKEIFVESNKAMTKAKTLFKIEEILSSSPEDPNILLFFQYINLVQKNYSNLKLRSCLSSFLEISTVNQIVDKVMYQKEEKNKIQSHPSFYMKYDPYTINILPKILFSPSYHKLGDRVVHIWNSGKTTNFGQTGTIIGIYKDKIEVVWDRPVIGGRNLDGRCLPFRGGIYSFFDLFNLSQWSKIVIKQDQIKEFDKCWEGDYDIKGLFDIVKKEQRKIFEEKLYVTKI